MLVVGTDVMLVWAILAECTMVAACALACADAASSLAICESPTLCEARGTHLLAGWRRGASVTSVPPERACSQRSFRVGLGFGSQRGTTVTLAILR